MRRSAPLRAAQYFGGKGGAIAQWIVANLPHHTEYIEPFGGLASVLLNKPRCEVEVYNEANLATANFMLCVKWESDRLIAEIRSAIATMTLDKIKELPIEPDLGKETDWLIHQAAHFYLHCEMSFKGGGLRWSSGLAPTIKYPNPNHLHEVSRRLRGVDIRHGDAISLIKKQSKYVLFYVDPPYDNAGRKSKDDRVKDKAKSMSRRQYAYELSEAQHIELRDSLEGRIAVVSGYKSVLYDELYQGWEVRSKRWQGDTEYLWISPEAMHQMSQLNLFGAIAQ